VPGKEKDTGTEKGRNVVSPFSYKKNALYCNKLPNPEKFFTLLFYFCGNKTMLPYFFLL